MLIVGCCSIWKLWNSVDFYIHNNVSEHSARRKRPIYFLMSAEEGENGKEAKMRVPNRNKNKKSVKFELKYWNECTASAVRRALLGSINQTAEKLDEETYWQSKHDMKNKWNSIYELLANESRKREAYRKNGIKSSCYTLSVNISKNMSVQSLREPRTTRKMLSCFLYN